MKLLLPFPIAKIAAIFDLKDKLKVSVSLSEVFVFSLVIFYPERNNEKSYFGHEIKLKII